MAISRPRASEGPTGPAGAEVKDPTLMGFPTVWEYLTLARYDDGSSRKLSALSVFVEDGSLKIALNDKDAQRSLYVAGMTLRDALEALEAKLSAGEGDWRAWGRATKKK